MNLCTSQFHIVSKPAGTACNMACEYCFYSEKKAFYPQQNRMSKDNLRQFVKVYLQSHPGPEVNFLWQGGEPLLMGIEFYKDAVNFQNQYAGNRRVTNSIQTNGTLLNEEWCRFLKQENFLVGISLDGPADVHDAYRKMCNGKSSFSEVLRGVNQLQIYAVDFNITACVSDVSAKNPLAVYQFFKDLGIEYLQFAPIVERLPLAEERRIGLSHASPDGEGENMAPGSVESLAYGQFLSAVFDEWVRKDVGKIYVMNFEWALAAWLGFPASYCIFSKECGNAFAAEHNGDLYVCDHFVYPEYHMGNLFETSMKELLDSPVRTAFSKRKSALPEECMQCEYRFACNGECPKNRFLKGGKNYLCDGYRYYFQHIRPYMRMMVQLYRAGKPIAMIKDQLKKYES